MVPEIATRVYNHTFRIDPIVRSLLDTDFYKLLMLQMIWKLHRHRRVTFQLINRSSEVRLADIVEERELIDQLDYARTLRFAKNELTASPSSCSRPSRAVTKAWRYFSPAESNSS